jgi:hypothetical protein
VPPPSRPSPLPRPAAPPPRPSTRSTLPPPSRTQPPASAPVAAPFETRPTQDPHPFAAVPVTFPNGRAPIDRPGDAIYADHWFEASRAVETVEETWVGTQPVPRTDEPASLVSKLIVPMAILVVVGVLVGGYFAFSGEGGKSSTPTPKAPAAAVAATDHDVTTALPPKFGGPTQPAAAEPTPAADPAPAPAAAPAPAPGADPAPAPAARAAAAADSVTEPLATTKIAKTPAAAAPAPAVAAVATTPSTPSTPTHAIARPPRGAVAFVDVRIDSKPSGATVMLVDNGKTSFLGTTPLSASVDAARAYDVIVTLEGRPTQMTHLDPAKTHRLDVALGKAIPQSPQVAKAVRETPAPAPAPAAAPPAARHHRHHDATPVATSPAVTAPAASGPSGGLVEPSFDAPAEAPAKPEPKAEPKAAKKTETAGASGTLMVSSKPVCAILIDGKDTGLSTPQRAIPLTVGVHKVTFINAAENVKKTVAVAITADQSTKLIQDLMKK